jgi:hypothetical protein
MVENVISKEERRILLKWICKNKNLFEVNPVSKNRNFLILPKGNHSNLFSDIKSRILKKENILENYMDEPTYRDYVGCISRGGQIHNHIDDSIIGYDHVRFNLFLSVPVQGGLPIYNGKTMKVDVGDYVRCNSSREYHSCERVMSRIPRIVISYGILLKQKNMSYF